MSVLVEIKKQYEALSSLTTEAGAAARRSRGYDFERLLNRLFELDQLAPRTSYRLDGEQIDG